MKLGEVIKQRKGFITIDDEKDYKLCRVQVNRRGVLLREVIKGALIRTKKQQVCKAGDFLVAEMDAKVGGYGFVPADLDGAIVSSHYFLFELDESKVRPKFIEVISKLGLLQEQIKATGSTNYAAIRPANVLNWEIPTLSIEHQKKIEKLYDEASLKSEHLSRELTYQLDLVKQLRRAFLREAMQGKLVPQDPNDEPASELLKKIKAEKEQLIKEKKIKKVKELSPVKPEEIPFEIPKNWGWCRLGKLGVCQTGTTPSTLVKSYFGTDIPFIKPADITLKGLVLNNEGLTLEGLKKGVLIARNSLMMVCIGGSIGKSYYNEVEVSCNQQINAITPLANVHSQFLHYWVQSEYFQKAIWAEASGGTTPIVNRSKWESISIPLPPLSEQHRIVAKLEQLMRHCDELEQSIKQSQEQNEQLLQQVLREALSPTGASLKNEYKIKDELSLAAES